MAKVLRRGRTEHDNRIPQSANSFVLSNFTTATGAPVCVQGEAKQWQQPK
jgi:hypothetical protein